MTLSILNIPGKKEQFQMKLKSKTGPGSGTVLNSEQINSNGDDWRSPKAATKQMTLQRHVTFKK